MFIKYIKAISVILFSLLVYVYVNFDELFQIPEYRLIRNVSSQFKEKYGLILSSYGINIGLTKDQKPIKGTANFWLTYTLYGTQNDVVPLDEARCLIASVTESFLDAINKDKSIRNHLDEFPFPPQRLDLDIVFVDQDGWRRGNAGIACAALSEGVVRYEQYEIYEYTPPHINGKYFDVLKEPYEKALETAKQQDCLNPI